MLRLLYFSTAKADISQNQVDGIVSHARGRNEDLGVTGALAWNGRNFCQVLEGEADTVRTLVTQIAQDDRHAGFKVLDEKTVAQRRFDGWSMKRVDALDFSEVINAMND